MGNSIKLGMGLLFSIFSQYVAAVHFETAITNDTNQALTIHCEDHACAYCKADKVIQPGETLDYWIGYNTGGGLTHHCFYDKTVAFLHFNDSNGKELYKAGFYGAGADLDGTVKWTYGAAFIRELKGPFSGFCTEGTRINYADNSSINLGDKAKFDCENGSIFLNTA